MEREGVEDQANQAVRGANREHGAPFGVKLDADRVVDAFDKVWDKGDQRGVVLVEASDLARLRRYMRFTTAEQFVSLRSTALPRLRRSTSAVQTSSPSSAVWM